MDWLIVILAAIISGLLGIAISITYYRRHEKYLSKLQTLKDFAGYRYDLRGEAFTRAINEIFIVFSDSTKVKQALKKFDAGVHLKTAGTTWLEELIGLALAGDDGLQIAKDIYAKAMKQCDELCKPYATVIDIDRDKLPSPEEVAGWDGQMFAAALRHDQSCERYNLHFRQMLHLSYKVAAKMGRRFTKALKDHLK